MFSSLNIVIPLVRSPVVHTQVPFLGQEPLDGMDNTIMPPVYLTGGS